MSDTDIVKKVLSSIEQGDFNKASNLISDDFRFKGPSLVSLGKEEYLKAHEALVSAIPDWKFNPSGWQELAGTVRLKVSITGTHTRPLRYPFPLLSEEQPTNKCIALPVEPTRVTVVNGKIAAIEADSVPGGGILGVLRQLGVKAPVPLGA